MRTSTRRNPGIVRRALAALAALLVAVAGGAPALAQTATPPALEVLSVTHDPAGSLVVALRAERARDAEISSLTMFVDDVPLRLVTDAREAAGDLALVLAMDTSGSMAGEPIQAAGQAARALLERLAPQDRVGVVTFASSPVLRTGLTADRGFLGAILGSLVADGWTALYDAVALGASQLEAAPEQRRVILLLSDGQDFGGVSAIGREGSIERAQASGATVHAVGLGPDYDEAYLQALADATGGQFFPMRDEKDVAALTALFTRLGGELGASETYTVPVSPLARGMHELRVRASVNGQMVTATTSFEVTNVGLLAPAVVPPAAMDRPIEVRFAPLVPASDLSLEMQVGDSRLRPASPGADHVAIDPWGVTPGVHEVEVVAYASGGVAYRETVSIDVPALEPRLTVTSAEDGLVARAQVQAVTPVLVAFRGDEEVARSTDGTLTLEASSDPTRVELRSEGGAVLLAEEVAGALPGDSSGNAALIVLLVALLGGAGYAGYRKFGRRRRRPVAERVLRPIRRAPPAEAGDQAVRAPSTSVLGQIVVLDGSGGRRVVPLTARPLTVGSSLACDIVVGDPYIRAEHLRLTALPGDEVRVHVLGERGSVPDQPYEPEQWLIARDGEQITLGSCVLQIVRERTHEQPRVEAEAGS